MIKFLDLHTLNARFETEFQQEFKKVLDSGSPWRINAVD